MALRRYRADLHIHTCLSPCAELSVYPRKIVERARAEGLALIAVADHNSAGNAAATIEAARGTGLTVLPGMEITSEEEVHILAVFGSMDDLESTAAEVDRELPDGKAPASLIEDQVLVNARDEVLGFHPRSLLGATRLNVQQVVDLVHAAEGLAIAAHIDREAFSLISQLGFIPPDLALDALEVSSLLGLERARRELVPGTRLPLIHSSDAHRPEEIGRASTGLILAEPSFDELRLAFRGVRGRRVCRS
jgi:PHP family Zn ribbon phosphoesterase